jgi:tRNA A-37 threonylcarbamoyl transferase component Bud32
MLEAHKPRELDQIVNRIKKKSLFRGITCGDRVKVLSINFGSENQSDTKYGWLGYHQTVEYNGIPLDIKVPTIIGKAITKSRYILEQRFNQEFISKESSEEAIHREIQTYEYLNNQNFPTLESLNHLFPEIKGAIITRKIEGTRHTIDIISKSDEKNQQIYVGEVAGLMKKLHDTNTIWGDAWLGNTMYDNDKLLLFDFGFYPNPSKSKEFLMGKDLVSLCMSAVYRTRQPAKTIVPAIIEAYLPSIEVSDSVNKSLYEKTKRLQRPITRLIEEKFYFNPVFGMDRKEVENVYEEIRKNIKKF